MRIRDPSRQRRPLLRAGACVAGVRGQGPGGRVLCDWSPRGQALCCGDPEPPVPRLCPGSQLPWPSQLWSQTALGGPGSQGDSAPGAAALAAGKVGPPPVSQPERRVRGEASAASEGLGEDTVT